MHRPSRPLHRLQIRDIDHLCLLLQTPKEELDFIARRLKEAPENFYRHFERKKPNSDKKREFDVPQQKLFTILDRLQKILIGRVISLPYLHGAVRGHSNITNAQQHINKASLVTLDIADFFPSIRFRMVYDIFVNRLGCTPDVAHYLTRLSTVRGRLPQGAPTSPMLAVLVSEGFARRIETLAEKRKVTFTLYIDDIACSAHYSIPESFLKMVIRIARQEGFKIKKGKTVRMEACEQVITGVRVDHGIDIPSKKVKEVGEAIAALPDGAQENDEAFAKRVRSLRGKINYNRKLNPRKGERQLSKLKKKLSVERSILP